MPPIRVRSLSQLPYDNPLEPDLLALGRRHERTIPNVGCPLHGRSSVFDRICLRDGVSLQSWGVERRFPSGRNTKQRHVDGDEGEIHVRRFWGGIPKDDHALHGHPLRNETKLKEAVYRSFAGD